MIYASHLIGDEEMGRAVAELEIGLESIEFSIAENLDSLDGKICAYRERMKRMGVRELILHGPFLDMNPMTYDSQIRRATRLRFEQAYEAAQRLGGKKLVFHTGFLPNVYYLTGWAERMAEFFNEFMEGKEGVQIVLENVYDPYPGPIARVKELVESPEFMLCLDIGHAHCYAQRPLEEWAKRLGPYVGHIHVHDNCGDRDAHLGLGRGNIPAEQILKELKRDAAEATCTVECMTLEEVTESCKMLKKWGFA